MYIWRILLAIVGFIVFIVILVSLFTGGKKPNPATTKPALQPLASYAETNATVSLITDGIVNGDELHRSIRITVSANQREVDVLQGYNPRVITSKTFVNNQEAYTVFLKAIANAGFVTKQKNSKAPADERGLCPLGFRYIYELNNDGDDLSRLWSSSCGSSVGTAAGSASTLLTLFQDQIPDYSTITSHVNLSATREQ